MSVHDFGVLQRLDEARLTRCSLLDDGADLSDDLLDNNRSHFSRRSDLRCNYDTIPYDTRCYFNVRSKADMSRLNLPHENDN